MTFLPIQPGGASQLAANFIVITIETVFIILRTASRALSKAPLGIDDVLVTVTYPLVIGINACQIAMVFNGGSGWHTAEVLRVYGPGPLVTWLKLQVGLAELYIVVLALPRLAILGLYLRLFTQKPVRIISRIMQAVLILYPLGFFITYLTICHPVSALWSPQPPPGACGNLDGVEVFISVPNIVTDVVLLFLPIRAIWSLKLSRKERLGVLVILCAGGMGLIVSCLRFAFWYSQDLSDILYVSPTISKFTSLETAGYFIAACIPVLKPIVDYLGKLSPLQSLRSLTSIFSRTQVASIPDSESQQSSRKTSAYSSGEDEKRKHSQSTTKLVNASVHETELYQLEDLRARAASNPSGRFYGWSNNDDEEDRRMRAIKVQHDIVVTRSDE